MSTRDRFKFASASLTAAVYREGDITLDGKKHHVVLVDANSNGRFDDPITPVETTASTGGAVYHTPGDTLLVDPDPKNLASVGIPEARRTITPVSKLWRSTAAFTTRSLRRGRQPDADALRRTAGPRHQSPRRLAGPAVRRPGRAESRATSRSRRSCRRASGDCWSTRSIVQAGTPPAAAKEKAKPAGRRKAEHSLLEASSGHHRPERFRRSRPRGSAPRWFRCGHHGLPGDRGPGRRDGDVTFRPAVQAERDGLSMDGKTARLQLSLVGAAGEACNNLLVQGGRPPKPQFTIKTPKGDVVQSGSFEYG